MQISDLKNGLSGMLHGGTLNRVRSIDLALERAANTLLLKIDPLDTIRLTALTNTVHDDIYDYPLPSDFKKIIDLYPQADRASHDISVRRYSQRFDLTKGIKGKTISIEASEGSKNLRVNWRSRGGKTLHQMNDYDDNGTWTAVGSATGIEQDTITKRSGSGSVRFDLVATADGIQNTTMSVVDMTDEDEVADIYVWIYFPIITNLTSVQAVWGNDLTAKYWTSVVQTAQADGSAFKTGWNLFKFPWGTATETGTVAPATIDSFKLIFNTAGVIINIRVDNIIFSIGKAFDIKYYSKFLLKNSSGTWITRTTSDNDTIVLDNDAIQLYQLESLIACAQQVEGEDSTFDLNFAKGELDILYRKYLRENPSQAVKIVENYGGTPSRGRW